MIDLENLGQTEYLLLDAIRRSHSPDRAVLALYSGLSWPTVKKSYTSLLETELIESSSKSVLNVKQSAGYFLGIAVGTREIKAVICDFSFSPVSRKDLKDWGMGSFFKKYEDVDHLPDDTHHICIPSSQDQDTLADDITQLIEGYLSLENRNLLGIGLAFPGVVDPEQNQIIACPNIPCLNGKDLRGLLKRGIADRLEREKIPIVIEHNAKVCFINEKEYLCSASPEYNPLDISQKNVLCIYMGTGIGLGGCFNRTLMTGSGNAFGELGHILSPIYSIGNVFPETISSEDTCPFCHRQCIEWLFRKKVFGASKIEEYRHATQREKLSSFHLDHPNEYKLATQYIGFLLNNVLNIFNPEVLILTGRLFDYMEPLRNDIESLKSSYTLPYVGRKCRIVFGSGKDYGVARGAAINLYLKKYSYRQSSSISWPF